MKYTPIIGLEIHVELKTKSKMFCQCDGNYFGKKPNTNVCPVCMGMPGALPVPNRQAVEWTIKIGQALNCTINKHSKFDRKHYFYPDLPKSYQISQYDEPIAVNGYLEIQHPPSISSSPPSKGDLIKSPLEGSTPKGGGMYKTFRITRVHLEEDTGKLTHSGDDTLVDFNRSSVPLVEIVTEPDFDNSEDVKIFLEELHTIIRYLDVSDADMEKGSMRLEPNISLMKTSSTASGPPPSREDSLNLPSKGVPEGRGMLKRELPNYKVEVKNINSFNYAKKAIDYELPRQAEILDKGETPVQETRGYNEDKGITYSQRSKEGAEDYRYFPEPDIPPMEFSDELLESIKKTIPELPAQKVEKYTEVLNIKYSDAVILTRDKSLTAYFEEVLEKVTPYKLQVTSQSVANAIVNKKISTDLTPEEFAKKVAELSKPKETDIGKLAEVIKTVIANNPKAVADYKGGNKNTLMFMVGQVMREMKGQADAGIVRGELEKILS